MPRPDLDDAIRRADELSVDAPGIDELQVLPWPLLLRRRLVQRVEGSERYSWIVLATALFGLFSVGFSITILSNSLKSIAADLGTDVSTISWVLTGPLLAFAVFGPSAGKLADLRGQRRIYLWSIAGVCLFAGFTAIAPNAGFLIAFRTLGAALGAATGPASLAMINRLFPAEQRARAMGWWSMVAAGAPVIGVVAGGPVVEAYGWRWIFVAQVPLTLATLVLAAAILPDTEPLEGVRFDLQGALLLGGAATSLLFGINRGQSLGWASPVIVGCFVATPVLIAAFVRAERRAEAPLFPLRYLRERNFVFPITTQFFTNFAYMGGFVITPLLLQNVFGYGETHSATLLIARPTVFSVAGPVAGALTLRIGERVSAVMGAAAITVSMLALAALHASSGDLVILAALGFSGLGMGASQPAMTAALANAVDEADLGVAGAAQQMMNQVGVVIGICVMQAVQAARSASDTDIAGYHDAYLVGAAMALAGVVAAMFVGRTVWRQDGEGAPAGAPSETLPASGETERAATP